MSRAGPSTGMPHIRFANTGAVVLGKLAERPFGNITKRRSVLYYRSKESRLKGIMILALKHNIIEY